MLRNAAHATVLLENFLEVGGTSSKTAGADKIGKCCFENN